MFLRDTNILSELRKVERGRGHHGVVNWAAGVAMTTMYLSVITLMEIEVGILLIARRDQGQADRLRLWLHGQIMPRFAARLLPVDATVALHAARLHVPDPKPERDALIAATALVHGMTVVTRNVADFAATGVAVFDPWSA